MADSAMADSATADSATADSAVPDSAVPGSSTADADMAKSMSNLAVSNPQKNNRHASKKPELVSVDKTVKDLVNSLLEELQQEEDANENIDNFDDVLYGRICELQKLRDLLDENCVRAKGSPPILKTIHKKIEAFQATIHQHEVTISEQEYQLKKERESHLRRSKKAKEENDQLKQQLDQEKQASQEKDLDYAQEQGKATTTDQEIFNLQDKCKELSGNLTRSEKNVFNLHGELNRYKKEVERLSGQDNQVSRMEQLQNANLALNQKVQSLEAARQQDSKNHEQALNKVKAERNDAVAKATSTNGAEWQKTAFQNYQDKVRLDGELVKTREDLVTARTEQGEAKAQAIALTNEKNKLRAREQALEQELAKANTAFQGWQNERTDMINAGRSVIQERDAMRQERDTATDTAKNMEQAYIQKVENLMDMGRGVVHNLNEEKERCNTVIAQRDSLQIQCNDLTAQLSKYVDLSKKVEDSETSQNTASAEREHLQNQYNDLATKLEATKGIQRAKEDELLSTQKSLDQLKKTKEDEVLAAQKSLEILEGKLDQLKKTKEDEVSATQKSLKDSRSELDRLKKSKEEIENTKRHLDEQCTKVNNQLNVREQEYSTLQGKYDAKETELNSSRQTLKRATEEALIKEKHIEDQDKKVSQLEQDLESQTTCRSKLEAQVKEEEETSAKATAEVLSRGRKIKKLKHDKNELESSLSAKAKVIDDLKDQVSKLTDERKAAEDNNTPLKEHKKAVDAQVKKMRLNLQPSLGDHKRLQAELVHLETEARKLVTQFLCNPNADHLVTAVDFLQHVLEEDCDVDELLSKRQVLDWMVPDAKAFTKAPDAPRHSSSLDVNANAPVSRIVAHNHVLLPIEDKAGVNGTPSEAMKVHDSSNIEDIHQDRPLGEQLLSVAPSMATASVPAKIQASRITVELAPLPISTTRLRVKCGLPRIPDDHEKDFRVKLEKLDCLMRRSNGTGLPKLGNPSEMMWDAESANETETGAQAEIVERSDNNNPALVNSGTQTDPVEQTKAIATSVDSGTQTESVEQTKAATAVVESGTQTEAIEQINATTNVVKDGLSDKIPPPGKEVAVVDSGTQTETTEQTNTVAKVAEDESTTSDQGSGNEMLEVFKIIAPTLRSNGPSALQWFALLAVLLAFLFGIGFHYVSHVRLEELLNRGDEYTRLALLSIRAGGGTGSAIPGWFWDDSLLEYIPGLYG